MRICLCNPHCLGGNGHNLLHGLLQICSEIKKHGHECRIMDFNAPAILGVLSVLLIRIAETADQVRSFFRTKENGLGNTTLGGRPKQGRYQRGR